MHYWKQRYWENRMVCGVYRPVTAALIGLLMGILGTAEIGGLTTISKPKSALPRPIYFSPTIRPCYAGHPAVIVRVNVISPCTPETQRNAGLTEI